MKVTHEVLESGVVSIRAEGRLDAATVRVFEQMLQRLLDRKHARLVVDMSDVNYISSSGLRALLTARRRAHEQGGDVLLCCLSPRVRQIFDMIGFLSVFGVYDEISQAVDVFMAMPAQAT